MGLTSMNKNRAILLTGKTGTGKSTKQKHSLRILTSLMQITLILMSLVFLLRTVLSLKTFTINPIKRLY